MFKNLRLLWLFIPFISRPILVWKHRKITYKIIPSEEKDLETNRNFNLTMCGFSFTGLLGLVVLENTIKDIHLDKQICFIFISFISYYIANNIQSYKFYYWMDELAIYCMETGSLFLILTIITSFNFCLGLFCSIIFSIVGVLIWYIDFCIHIYCTNKSFEGKMKKKIKKPNPSNKPPCLGLGFEQCPIHKTIYHRGGTCPDCINQKKSE